MADQLLLVWQSEPASRRSARDDQALRVNLVFANVHQEWPLAQIGAGDVPQLIFGAKTLCLLAHVLNQFGSLNTFGETGKIFYQRSDRKLAAGLVAFNDKRL